MAVNSFRIISVILLSLLMLFACKGERQGEAVVSSDAPVSTVHDKSARSAVSPDPYTVDSIAYMRWGNPASPYRDEERYIDFLNHFLAVDTLPQAVRLRAEERLRVASLNRRGTIANDFEFIDRDGRRGTLHGTQGPEIMLIFYDPECPHCGDILAMIAGDEGINKAIADGTLTVLAIYTEGKRGVWDRTKAAMPANWEVGYDMSGILDNGLYDLPAMPIIYILDSSRRVILKDPEVTRLLSRT